MLRDIVVAFANALVSADFGILALPLLHQSLQLSIVGVRDRLRLHLHHQLSAGALNARADFPNSCLQRRDSVALVQARVRQNVEWRRNKSDLHLVVLGVICLGRSEGSLDRIDAFIIKACDLDICANFRWLGRQPLSDVRFEFFGIGAAWEGDIVPDLGVPCIMLVLGMQDLQ